MTQKLIKNLHFWSRKHGENYKSQISKLWMQLEKAQKNGDVLASTELNKS